MTCTYRISATQLKLFHPETGCPRKWALHYLQGVDKGTSEALLLGSAAHAAVHQLLTRGNLEGFPARYTGNESTPEETRRAKAAQLAVAWEPYAPTGSISEDEWYLERPDIDTKFDIRPDLHHRPSATFYDWKTTAAPDPTCPWALQSQDHWDGPIPPARLYRGDMLPLKLLRDDWQANLNAHGLMERWDVPELRGVWVYAHKHFKPGARPRCWTVEHVFKRAAAREFFERNIIPTTQLMNRLRAAGTNAMLVPHQMEFCGGTGRWCETGIGHCGFQPSPISLPKFARHLPVLK